jgi:hypothetical protein
MDLKKFRITFVATWLFFLAASLHPAGSGAFVPSPCVLGIKRSHRSAFSSTLIRVEKERDLEEPRAIAIASDSDTTKKMKQDAFLFVYNVISLVWYSVGVAGTMSIALNLFGYSFVYTKTDGFRIDTIQELRIEQQFQHQYKEDYRMTKRATIVSTETKPPSQQPQ